MLKRKLVLITDILKLWKTNLKIDIFSVLKKYFRILQSLVALLIILVDDMTKKIARNSNLELTLI